MAVIGIYTKDFPNLGRALLDSDLMVIGVPGDVVTYKITYGQLKAIISGGTEGRISQFDSNGKLVDSILSQIGNAINLNSSLGTHAAFGIVDPGTDNGAYIGSTINNDFLIRVNNTEALRIDTALRLKIANIQNAITDTDKFLVSDGGVVKYRTGAEVLSDLGAITASSAANLTNKTGNISQWTNDSGYITSASLSGYVPYTGATTNVNLGTHSLTAADLVINHASGSGVAASITKGGNGEALTVVKTSGSGNAASITGGVTLLSELNLTTALADSHIASAANWNAAYNDKINSASVTGTTTKTLTLTQQDGGAITASWTDINTDAVTSVNGLTGAVTLTTSNIAEGTNQYFTQARARTSVSYTPGSAAYNSSTGVFTIPTNTAHLTNGSGFITLAQARAGLSFTAGSGAYNSSTGVITIPTDNNQIGNGAGYITSSALSGYLPLSGGTLTGALNGTSAVFSGGVTATRLTANSDNSGVIVDVAGRHGLMKYSNYATGLVGANTDTDNNISTWLGRFSGSITSPTTVYQDLVISNSGNVGIGTASPTTYSLSGIHTEIFGGSTYSFLHVNTTNVKSFYAANESAGLAALFTFSNHALTLGTSNTERMRITSGGNVLIGTTTDNGAKLQVEGGNATVSGNVTATAFFNSSDMRLKDIIKRDGDVAYYKWKDGRDDKEHIGLIAQEVQAIYPDMVNEDADGFLSVNYTEYLLAKVLKLEQKLKQHGLE